MPRPRRPPSKFAADRPTSICSRVAGVSADGRCATETAAIQQVIQRGNEAQVEAIAARDPAAMSDTATASTSQLGAHQRQLGRQRRKRIALLNLEWGPVSVDGAAARRLPPRRPGAPLRGRHDRTVARPERVRAGSRGSGWKVRPTRTPGHRKRHGPARPTPAVRRNAGAIDSRNTSAQLVGLRRKQWQVHRRRRDVDRARVQPDRPFGVDAAWVGIGGVRSRDLIQAGTSQTISSSGATQYQAWVETLPEAAEPVPLAVHPGDTITVTITEKSDDTWLLELVNETTGEKYERTEQYDSSYSSAEWIQEAPSSGGGRLLPLANFGAVHFSNAWAVKDGKRVTIAEARAGRPITMIGRRQSSAGGAVRGRRRRLELQCCADRRSSHHDRASATLSRRSRGRLAIRFSVSLICMKSATGLFGELRSIVVSCAPSTTTAPTTVPAARQPLGARGRFARRVPGGGRVAIACGSRFAGGARIPVAPGEAGADNAALAGRRRRPRSQLPRRVHR